MYESTEITVVTEALRSFRIYCTLAVPLYQAHGRMQKARSVLWPSSWSGCQHHSGCSSKGIPGDIGIVSPSSAPPSPPSTVEHPMWSGPSLAVGVQGGIVWEAPNTPNQSRQPCGPRPLASVGFQSQAYAGQRMPLLCWLQVPQSGSQRWEKKCTQGFWEKMPSSLRPKMEWFLFIRM